MGSLALPTNYQHVVVRGPPYERGLSHGQQAREKILASLEHYSQPGKLLPWDMCQRIIHEVYIPGVEKFFPEALPEMQGIADGAGVDLEKIVLLNARYDLARVRGAGIRACPSDSVEEASSIPSQPEIAAPIASAIAVESLTQGIMPNANGYTNGRSTNGTTTTQLVDDESSHDPALQECTAAGILAEATTSGSVLLVQNWDMSASVYTNDTALLLEVHPDPSEGIPAMFLVTEAGQLGRSGINAAGLAVCACSLMSTEDYFPLLVNEEKQQQQQQKQKQKQAPLLPMTLMRRQFLHNINFSNGLINIRNAPRHVSNRLVVGTADNFVLNMEVTPSAVHLAYPYATSSTYTPVGHYPFVVGANHFVNPAFHASGWADRNPGGSTWFRDVRVAQGLRRPAGVKGAVARKVNTAEGDGDAGGLLTPEDVTQAFCDHLSAPSSVCQHMEDCTVRGVPDYPYRGRQITLAHVRYDLTRRTATVCKGPPCMGVFQEFAIPPVANC
ncbi:peptidase C45 acyl-coenzyme A:6-aminopenicillanic acid acyl-transferase [Purpureocillium lilacinum]|uniref:Peptidase C45 acyl-coenzyme A:6-aminopenicillanic acid acyl-transferase n=1 Tax=Purpureocillium lilacinum TaxID=33203 RepID=A0A179GDN9_PURLI|nr:peptidase C45 acyl-coenzyme A:6-aminopenicillanic acid acyl-transferase [Purpureocillium lilacinum]OAQ75935.1 peptidase C45 acyl-coenzyme A:6-aminopenicillanic acid acyl-transferase [Purpureocillium lilacinum]PWI64913.1 hypothetical protein PCL_08460 [Purpureocillium lilacinum]